MNNIPFKCKDCKKLKELTEKITKRNSQIKALRKEIVKLKNTK